MTARRGHSVLQLPVPPLERWVRRRTAHHDPAFVSADDRFGHAHITALGPFDPRPTREVLAQVAAIAAATPPIVVRLAEIDQFPDGIIHLLPEPREPLSALTDRLVAQFPGHPPYGGAFGPRPTPHLTLDLAGAGTSIRSTGALLGDLVPVSCRLEELQLAWWEADNCHVRHTWRLGG